MMKKLEAVTISQDESVHDFSHMNINSEQEFNELSEVNTTVSDIFQKVRAEKLTGKF